MATRVGLLDADSDVSDDDDTPLGVAGARRLAKRVDGDDFMDEDARDDAIVDLYDSRATAEALRAHEDALEELRARQTSTADAFGAFLSVDDGENEARALATDSNEARGDAVARPRPPPMARALAHAMRATASMRYASTRAAPATREASVGGVDAYGALAGSRGAAFGARGALATPAIGDDGVVACAVRTKMTFAGVVGALEVALDQSVRRASGGLRQACSRESTESKPYGIAATCLRQLEAVVEALANSNGDDVVARDRAAAEVSAWALVSELFAEDKLGASRGTAAEVHRRRAGVSAWLREQVARAAPSEEELFGRRAALTHVAGGRTVSAARAAAAHGDPRLATCLAQIGAGKNVAFYAKQQLTRWRAGSVGKYIDEFSEQAFKLLAGEVERDDDGMGWYQNLGLHMWLAAGPTSPLRDVVKNYLDAVAQQRAANPLPPVATYEALDANQATHLRDVAFNILALAASTEDEGGSPSTAEVRVAFHPLTYSDDVLNASLAWHLFGVLNAIGVLEGEGMDALADEITVAFATQLLGMPERGRCEWAVFVSQHLRDDTRRTKMTGHILRERFEEWKCDDGKIAFIKDVCAVPQESLDDAHALWDVYSAPRP